jgi:WD40 repeat protein
MSRRSQNPYGSDRKLQEASENQRRVSARKAEAAFLQGLRGNFSLEHYDAVKSQTEASLERRAAESSAAVSEKPKKRLATRPSAIPASEPFRAVQTFRGVTRCVESTQGGATLWTATNEGSITVRSGNSGLVVVTIPPHGDAIVDVLHSTATHMWAGLSDGTVQVFDHLVFIKITEGTFHTAPVTAFCSVADGRMFSSSTDGSLIKWDTESKNFEAMTRFVPGHTKGITALAASGYTLFSSSEDGSIIAIDIETGASVSNFSGHNGAVSCLCVIDGYLFSAADDTPSPSIQVWNVHSGNALKRVETTSLCRSLVPNPATHTVWIGFASGLIEVWRSLPDEGFLVERTIRDHEGRPLVSLKGFAAVETLRVWSLSSNGVNKVWCSSLSSVESAMRETVDALRAVITQDTIELDKWRMLVLKMQNIDRRRKLQLAHSLQTYHRNIVLRRHMWNWSRVVLARQERRRQHAVSNRLANDHRTTLIRHSFSKWFHWYRSSQNIALRKKYADVLQSTAKKTTLTVYIRKMQSFTRTVKTLRRRQELIRLLGVTSSVNVTRAFFRKWVKFLQLHKISATKVNYARTLFACSSVNLMRMYFHQWRKRSHQKSQIIQRQQFLDAFVKSTAHGNRVSTFRKWRDYVTFHRRQKKMETLAELWSTNTMRGLMASAWRKWHLYCNVQQLMQVRKTSERALTNLNAIKSRYSELEWLLEKKKSIAATKEQIQDQDLMLERNRLQLLKLQRECAAAREQMAAKQLEDSERLESVQERLENLMSLLKANTLNLYSDCGLFQQVREKIRLGQLVTKIFLESHQCVKRIIVELTKNPTLTNERWPLTPEMILRIPAHHQQTLLIAIKTMIVTFDIMDMPARDSLTSDKEIVANADFILQIANLCLTRKRSAAPPPKK